MTFSTQNINDMVKGWDIVGTTYDKDTKKTVHYYHAGDERYSIVAVSHEDNLFVPTSFYSFDEVYNGGGGDYEFVHLDGTLKPQFYKKDWYKIEA